MSESNKASAACRGSCQVVNRPLLGKITIGIERKTFVNPARPGANPVLRSRESRGGWDAEVKTNLHPG